MHLSDETLIARVAQGDPHALEVLYDRHAALVLGVLLRILGERRVAEEMLQETFFQAWKRAASYSAQTGSLTGWLFQIARGLAIVKLNGK